MAVFVKIFYSFGLTISESKEEAMCMLIPRAPATQIIFNATGQPYRQTTSFAYLAGAVTETPNLSDEIHRRIRAGWMSFKRYTWELYDRPRASLLHLKARVLKSTVVDALPYGCATLQQAPSNTSQDDASNPKSMAQVDEQPHPFLQRRPPANRM